MDQLPVSLAIVGATGAVGGELLKVLEKREFPIKELHCFASPRSMGKELFFRGKPIPIKSLSEEGFKGIDIAIFSAGSKISREWIPLATKQGVKVVDNSSAFRMDPEVPLVIPEINTHALKEHHWIASCPNCSTAIMLMAVAPLHRVFNFVVLV